MRIDAWRARGLIPFPGEVSVDFNALPGLITAIWGSNGSGKTVMLESIEAAFTATRVCPTRGSLPMLATGRDSLVDVHVTNGKPYHLVHHMDAVSGKSEAEAYDAGGVLLAGPKVSAWDTWAKDTLPDTSVLFASTICAQEEGGFLAMKPTARKQVILRALGTEKLEGMAKDARERARSADAAYRLANTRLADEKRHAGIVEADDDVAFKGAVGPAVFVEKFAPGTIRGLAELVPAAEIALQEATMALDVATVESQRADEFLRLGRAEATRIAELNDVRRAQAATRNAAYEKVLDCKDKLEALRGRLRKAAIDPEMARAIQEAAAIVASLDAELGPLREKVAELKGQEKAAHEKAETALRAKTQASQTARHAAQKVIEAEGRAKERTAAAEEAKGLPAQQTELTAAEGRLAAAEAELERLSHVVLAGAEGRIEGLRVAHRAIVNLPCGGDYRSIASEALAIDDAAVEAAQNLPGEREAARKAKAAAQLAIQALKASVRWLEGKRALAEAPSGDDAVVEADTKAKADLAAATEAETAAQAQSSRLQAAIAEVTAIGSALAARRETALPLAGRVGEIGAADALVASLTGQVTEAEVDVAAAEAALAALPTPAATLAGPDVVALEKQARDQGERVVERRGRLAEAEKALARAKESAGRIETFATERAKAEQRLAVWSRLANDIPLLMAAIVDASGPELTTIANDLLHNCVGPRWTVQVETQKVSADGQKMIEGCPVTVIDAEEGTVKEGEYLSPGQRALVGEAIRLALAQIACRTWNVRGCTLIRDESGAAVSADLAAGYVLMLRRAAMQIGCARVLLVTHNPDILPLCDSRIVVENGGVEVLS